MAFNGVGFFTIAPGQSFRLDGWVFPGGNGDHGAQYFSAHPLNPSGKLVMDDQNKLLGGNGIFSYGFRVTNEGPFAVNFNVQGGGFG